MDRLVKMGFKRLGTWKLNGNILNYELESGSELKNVLYAFISEGSVLYIGKTVQPLKKRMYGYQNPGPTQSTNIKKKETTHEITDTCNNPGTITCCIYGG